MSYRLHCVAVAALLSIVAAAHAQTPPPQPFNWVRQIGTVAVNPDQIRLVMDQVPLAERAEFTRRVLKAIGSMPASPEEKAKRMSRAAVALVASSGEAKRDVIVAVFAHCPILSLGAVSQALSVGFDQQKNKLSDEAYLAIATNLMAGVVAEVAKGGLPVVGAGLTDPAQPDAIVRLTVTAATLIRSASDPAALEPILLAMIPSDSRALVARVLPAAVKGDYGPLMDLVGNEDRMVLPMVYQTAAVQISLLTQMDIRRSADESRFVSVGIERQWGTRAPRGLVIPRPIPGGYQNQGIPDRIQEIIDRVTDRLEGGIPGGWRPGFGCGVPIIGCGLPIVGCGGFPGIGCGLPGVGPGLPDAGGCGSVIGPCDSGSLIP